MLVINSTFVSNSCNSARGGAILNFGPYARLTIQGSTFNANRAQFGGAIENDVNNSVLVMQNSTLSSNIANAGGALSTFGGAATLQSCTIAHNVGNFAGAGLVSRGFETLMIGNTLIASNIAPTDTDLEITDGFGTLIPFTSLGHNLIGVADNTLGWTNTDLLGSAASPLDARIATPTNNGGLTWTCALLPGSPAIDGGDCDTNGVALITDQRGVIRPQGSACDIGAFERQVGPAVFGFARSGNAFSVSVNTQPGKTYFLEVTPALDNTAWTPVANAPGTGTVQALTDSTATNAQSFYRVRIE